MQNVCNQTIRKPVSEILTRLLVVRVRDMGHEGRLDSKMERTEMRVIRWMRVVFPCEKLRMRSTDLGGMDMC